MSVSRAQREIDSREFSEWQAFWAVEPWGDERADIRSAMICCVTANAWRGKDDPPATLKDFLPKFGAEDESPEEIEPDTADDLKRKLIAFTRALGGSVKVPGPANRLVEMG